MLRILIAENVELYVMAWYTVYVVGNDKLGLWQRRMIVELKYDNTSSLLFRFLPVFLIQFGM